MPVGEGFFPPAQYALVWGVLAAVIILAVVLFYAAVLWFTRAQEKPEAAPADISWLPVDTEELRVKYVDQIDRIAVDHRRGALTGRAAHQQLSLLLRFFAFEADGVRAPNMTLSDLKASAQLPLADAVARFYPGAFAADEPRSVEEAVDTARQVVRSWN